MGLLIQQTAYSLVASGELTIGEAARAAGVHRALVAHWCKGLPAGAARDFYFAHAWGTFRAAFPALDDRTCARLTVERGAGTPGEVASILEMDVRKVHRWIQGIDYKAARRAVVLPLWSAGLAKSAASRAEQGLSSDFAWVKRGKTLRRVPV